MSAYIELILHSNAYTFADGAITESAVMVKYSRHTLEFQGQWHDLLNAGVVTEAMRPPGKKRKLFSAESEWRVTRDGTDWYTVTWWHRLDADGREVTAA